MTMAAPFRASSAATRAAAAALVLLAAATPTSCVPGDHLRLSDSSLLEVDHELPGPNLDNGSPTKLYSLSLGRVRRDHAASASVQQRRGGQGRRALQSMTFEETPLLLGYGTHFAMIYVGTPPQRASVIVNTGSHFTAFPCSECRNCGNHTDPSWDPAKSSTSDIVSCDNNSKERCPGSYRCQAKEHGSIRHGPGEKRCVLYEKYLEGSSWKAHQVEDLLWVGELTLAESKVEGEPAFSVDYVFGCIESLTGLFKTQLADGIMGMNANPRTLISQLAQSGKIKERIFSLCFSATGGTMVIGGYDPRLNKPGSEMQYTPSTGEDLAPRVEVVDMTLNGVSIAADPSVFNQGSGMRLVSGTTDTYLPRSIEDSFSDAWEAATGSPYSTCRDNHFCMTLTTAELEALPVLTIHLDGGVAVNVRPEAYMDPSPHENEKDIYAPRIYLTDASGGNLGANVFRDHNIVFDYDNHLVGIAEGACDYHAGYKRPDTGSPVAKVRESGPGPAVETEENVDRDCTQDCP
eukprot:g13038.t1